MDAMSISGGSRLPQKNKNTLNDEVKVDEVVSKRHLDGCLVSASVRFATMNSLEGLPNAE